jgi:3-hydroxyisobutyrate dehydrogenase-like beta-hydroxyacid dehydrogenase
MERVGIIGTGQIGSRIGRLLNTAGYNVLAYDVSDVGREQARSRGIVVAPALADVARHAEVVITCVTNGSALHEVVAGAGGLAELLSPGTCIIDTTSAEPWITQALTPLLQGSGIEFLDAPVSGGVPAAEHGRMNFMVGGDPALLDRWRPLLGVLGPVVTRVGPVGSGHALKAVNMLSMASSLLATAEIIGLGQGLGIVPTTTIESLNSGLGGSYVTKVHYPQYILPKTYRSGFTFALMRKDLGIAVELARRLNVGLFVGNLVDHLYGAASHLGFGDGDNTRVVDLILLPDRTAESATPDASARATALSLIAQVVNAVIGAEALLLGTAAGIDPYIVAKVLCAGSGGNAVLATMYRDDPSASTIFRLSDAALAGAEDTIRGSQQPALLTRLALEIWKTAQKRTSAGGEAMAAVDLLQSWSGGRISQDRRHASPALATTHNNKTKHASSIG